MRIYAFTMFYVLSAAMCANAIAQITQCESALMPTEEHDKSDYARTMSYMSINAGYEYDRLHSIDKEAREASGSYKLFEAEYNDSRDREQFQENIRQRLAAANFNLKEAEAKSHYRRDLSEHQLSAWSKCVQELGGVSHVVLSSRTGASNAIPLRVNWRAGQAAGTGTLNLSIANGRIDNKNVIQQNLLGSGSYAYMLEPTPGDEPIVIVANINGAVDDIAILKKYPEVELPPTKSVSPANLPAFLDVKFAKDPYTTEGDGRISKHLTCPEGKAIVPNSGSCHRTASGKGKVKKNEQLGPYTWACEWDTPQDGGVGLWVEAHCGTPTRSIGFRNVEHARINYTTEGDGRISKQLTCPVPKIIIPGSGTCLLTAPGKGKIKKSEQVGAHTWACEWDTEQDIGVGMWVEADCGEKVKEL